MALKKTIVYLSVAVCCLTSKSVHGTSLAFQGIDNIHGGDCLSLGMLCVGDGITVNIFQEYLQDTTGFFVDQLRDTFGTTSFGKKSDGWFCYMYTLDISRNTFP